MAGITSLKKSLAVLMVLYVLAMIGALIAAVPMIEHVSPRSECLLFSSQIGDSGRLSYGNYAACSVVGYVQIIMAVGGFIMFVLCWSELRRRKGHAKAGEFEEQYVPDIIFWGHMSFLLLGLLLAIITTAGYVSACENLRGSVSSSIRSKLNEDPYNTRGEEIETRYEDDYKFFRYTNTYANAFGAKFYTISITCKSILTDPEIYQKLHDTHYDQQSRYYGYWYGTDLYAFDSQTAATRTNTLVEASMAGCWISAFMWIAGCILIFVQKHLLRKEADKSERMSVHSAMMGSVAQNGSTLGGSTFRRDGSLMSGSMRGSSFQRGGPGRGSDRSIKSTRRDVDDIALFMHHMGGSRPNLSQQQQPVTGYGRKELDDLALDQHILNNQPRVPNLSQYSSMETGYVSDNVEVQYTQPDFSHFVPNARPVVPQPTSSHHYRDEVETEIF